MALEKIGYKNVVTADGPLAIKSGPAGFFGFVVGGGSAVSVAVYDGTDVSGAVLYSKASLAAGDVVHFGGVGIAASKGLFVVVGGTGAIVSFLLS